MSTVAPDHHELSRIRSLDERAGRRIANEQLGHFDVGIAFLRPGQRLGQKALLFCLDLRPVDTGKFEELSVAPGVHCDQVDVATRGLVESDLCGEL